MEESILYSIISSAVVGFVSVIGLVCKLISRKLDDNKYKKVKLALEKVEKTSETVKEEYSQNANLLVEQIMDAIKNFNNKPKEQVEN